ncbi:hypothetical protein ACHABQ_00680 [Nesterenkonia aurantiaca]|uniref:hypothetical protein n=1 Tax=Nesterenkonia aurantiaca TaxID=1436010 RepID=UPI003EE51068
MTSNDRAEDRSAHEPAPRARRRTPLGPPHDAYATVGLTVASAAALFFNGRVRAQADALGWIGMIVSLVAIVGLISYLQRAYGFSPRGGWGGVPTGAVIASFFGSFYIMQFIPAALYEAYFEESLLGYTVSCLALAMVVFGFLRAGLGRATARSDSR